MNDLSLSRKLDGHGRNPSWPLRRLAAAFAWVLGAVARWRRRERAIEELMSLDDKTLADIGLHRTEIRSAVKDAAAPEAIRERRRSR